MLEASSTGGRVELSGNAEERKGLANQTLKIETEGVQSLGNRAQGSKFRVQGLDDSWRIRV